MKVYVELESLLLQDLKISEYFYDWERKFSYNDRKFFLPYNPTVISFLKDEHQNDTVVLVVSKQKEEYASVVLEDFTLLFDIRTSGFVVGEPNVEPDNLYIGSYLDYIAKDQTIEKVYVADWLSGFWNRIRSKNSRLLSLGLKGIFGIPMDYSFILWPILANWVVWWFSIDKLNIRNLDTMFISTSLFMSSFNLLRTFLELNNERTELLKNGNEVLLGEEFIYGNYSLFLGVLYMVVFALGGITSGIFGNFFVMIQGLIIAIVYNIFALSSFKTRITVMIPLIAIMGFLSQWQILV